ncbi:hypothetical protein Tco_0907097 [Tanacetum coccineum]|uniref:Uncharacterized protein n=1 Tax=Tanacetum coccineum TaxID=301880 RepID=A0ABQ5CL72_9ASTR
MQKQFNPDIVFFHIKRFSPPFLASNDRSVSRDLFAIAGLWCAVVVPAGLSFSAGGVSDIWWGIVETIVSAMSCVGVPDFTAALAILITGASQSRQHGKSEPLLVNRLDHDISSFIFQCAPSSLWLCYSKVRNIIAREIGEPVLNNKEQVVFDVVDTKSWEVAFLECAKVVIGSSYFNLSQVPISMLSHYLDPSYC